MMDPVFKRISNVALHAGGQTAFLFMDENDVTHTVSFSRFREDLHKAAAAVSRLTDREKNERFAVLAANSYEYIVCMLGIMGAGKTAVLLNTDSSSQELDYEIALSDIRYIIQDGTYAQLDPAFTEKYSDKLLDMNFFASAEPEYDIPKPDMNALGLLLFTSGTTGVSKGVMLSHENVAYGTDSCLDYLEQNIITGDDMFFGCFPLYHVGGAIDALAWMLTGRPMVLNLDKRFFFRDLAAFPCTFISLVPAVLETVCKYFRRGRTGCIGNVKKILTSAARCEPGLFGFFKGFGIEVYQLYGLSENTGVGLYNFSGKRYDSIGTPQKHVRFRLDNGEICLSGEAVMMGYLKNTEATEEILRDGWLHTGDMGRVDEDGFVYITGRKKNLIILASGENISPEELESLILQDPAVTETVVREEGSRICAEIFCDDSCTEHIREHIDNVNRQLPYYKRVSVIKFRQEPFPRTATGKIKR